MPKLNEVKKRYNTITDVINEQIEAAHYFLKRAPNRKSAKCKDMANLLLSRAKQLSAWLTMYGPTEDVLAFARELEIGYANRNATRFCG